MTHPLRIVIIDDTRVAIDCSLALDVDKIITTAERYQQESQHLEAVRSETPGPQVEAMEKELLYLGDDLTDAMTFELDLDKTLHLIGHLTRVAQILKDGAA